MRELPRLPEALSLTALFSAKHLTTNLGVRSSNLFQTVRKLRDTLGGAQISPPVAAQSKENRENRFSARPYGASHRVFRTVCKAFAERMRGVFDELADLSASAAARELERRGYATPRGGKWSAIHVIRIRARLEASS
jgi:hypothetical protein